MLFSQPMQKLALMLSYSMAQQKLLNNKSPTNLSLIRNCRVKSACPHNVSSLKDYVVYTASVKVGPNVVV